MENLLSRITSNPEIRNGRPCIRDMRFTVTELLELLASGMTEQEILADYPYLEEADIQACLTYAALISKTKRIIPIA
ncbi:MAG: DUF433 domain-containing protein [Cytophagaceae bacterium]|nr:DUF433 domain-containing protein [Cytophagaceae bacterium]